MMKNTFIAALCCLALVCCSSKPQKVVILGDSYSTFEGLIPEGYACWYFSDERGNDVHSADSTWWKILCADKGYELLLNSSFSGSTICNRGYNGLDYTAVSFVTRMKRDIATEDGSVPLCRLRPDLILIFGGTNDSWSGAPAGKVLPRDKWQDADLYQCLPATSYMLGYLTEKLPKTRIVMILNSELRDEITDGLEEASRVYGVESIRLKDIDKIGGHPSKKGMKAIAAQLEEIL